SPTGGREMPGKPKTKGAATSSERGMIAPARLQSSSLNNPTKKPRRHCRRRHETVVTGPGQPRRDPDSAQAENAPGWSADAPWLYIGGGPGDEQVPRSKNRKRRG